MPAFLHPIGTAVPKFVTEQQRIADFMVNRLKLDEVEERKLRVLYRASGIQQRYSVLGDFGKNLNGKSFFKEDVAFPSAKPRMLLYQEHAIGLATTACKQAVEAAGIDRKEITHLIAISCTGMYAPGLDIELIDKLDLNTATERTSINFMGCYAAFNGMKAAYNIVRANPDANVLVVCVELCSIHLQEKKDEENILANAIFGDGAAATVVAGEARGACLEMKGFYSDLAPQGKNEMGWYIGDQGFEMKLTSKVPEVIQDGIQELTHRLLARIEMSLSEIDFFAIHPGGKRILEVIEEKLNISREDNEAARQVLRDYGNMSSPTILFVIREIMEQRSPSDSGKNLLTFAFGPGLTMESAVLTYVSNAEA